ncbi:MAG: hypothetical protein ACYTGJ_13960 [Planctomycetota bacterium]|jgi:hypothetical protein
METALKSSTFIAAYRDLEQRMQALAEADGDVFVPNLTPHRPVEHVFICMEPSLGRWAKSVDEGRARVAEGMRNFLGSIEDQILHYSSRHFLCADDERCFVTDLSKGAMLVKDANVERTRRYDRWYTLLLEELDLVARPGATILAVGTAVAKHLEPRRFPHPFTTILHYSGQAAKARRSAVDGLDDELEQLKHAVPHEKIIESAIKVLEESGVPESERSITLRMLQRSKMTHSRYQLLLAYKIAFESIRGDR